LDDFRVFGLPELFLEVSEGFKIFNQKFVKNTGLFSRFNRPSDAFFSWFVNFP